MMPEAEFIVWQVRASKVWDFTTQEGLCAYSNAVIAALHKYDINFGHLSKTEGQNHCTSELGRNHAVDAALYKDSGQVVDFIQSAGFGIPAPDNNVVWQPGPIGEYDNTHWFAPIDDGTSGPPPTPSTFDLTAVLRRLNDLENEFKILETTVNDNHTRMEEINNRFEKESNELNVHKPLPDYVGVSRIFGGTVVSKPKV